MTRRTICILAAVAAAITWLPLPPCRAQNFTIDTVLTGLDQPSGVAIRPGGTAESYEVFVAEGGARRVVKMQSDKPGQIMEVITEFPAPAAGSAAGQASARLSLLFLDRTHLVVGSGGSLPEVRLFDLAAAESPLPADGPQQRLVVPLPTAAEDGRYGNFAALARTRPNDFVGDILLVAVTGDARVSGLWKLPIRAGTLSEMSRVETKNADPAGSAPAAVVVNEQGYIVTADPGPPDKPRENRLMFQNPINGQIVMKLPTELHEIVGLAYSSKSGNLFAIDIAREAPAEGGVFRIEDASQPGRPACKAVRIESVRKPAALAFGPDGALYVAAWNDADSATSKPGVMLRITGEL